MCDEVFHHRSKEVIGGSSKPYYYVDDLNYRGRVFVWCQMEVELFAYEKLFGFLSVPVELPHL